jgi:hypothetical protein
VSKPIVENLILSVPAAALMRAAPVEWATFKEALKRYADEQRDNLVRASLDELQRSQGRAQQCSQLVALFEDAGIAADRISERAGRK